MTACAVPNCKDRVVGILTDAMCEECGSHVLQTSTGIEFPVPACQFHVYMARARRRCNECYGKMLLQVEPLGAEVKS